MDSGPVGIETQRLTIEGLRALSAEICTICQISFAVRQYVVGLSCGHGFHRSCFVEFAHRVN